MAPRTHRVVVVRAVFVVEPTRNHPGLNCSRVLCLVLLPSASKCSGVRTPPKFGTAGAKPAAGQLCRGTARGTGGKRWLGHKLRQDDWWRARPILGPSLGGRGRDGQTGHSRGTAGDQTNLDLAGH